MLYANKGPQIRRQMQNGDIDARLSLVFSHPVALVKQILFREGRFKELVKAHETNNSI